MRALVQRVRSATVSVRGQSVASIAEGALVLLGVRVDDGERIAEAMASKISKLRIFPDDAGVMNRSILDHGGAILAVSQFTLYGDARKGNRPSYIQAAPGPVAEPIYASFCKALREASIPVGEGVFGADMDVSLVNWGPVTIFLDSDT